VYKEEPHGEGFGYELSYYRTCATDAEMVSFFIRS
jgi:hypothetical protein